MRTSTQTCLIALVLLVCLWQQPASAFWNLFEGWPGQNQKQDGIASPLEDLRNTECGDPLARNKFGETEFMRGRRTKYELSKALRKSMAAAFLAETPQDATAILTPYLSATSLNERAAARIGLAFAHLRKAAGDRQVQAKARELVSHAEIADRVDTKYIKGTLALYQRDWKEVKSFAEKVLEREPQHYNANVLRSLSVLQSLAGNRRATSASQCHATLSRMIAALRPVMELGACPTQMAHLDVTSQRYLSFPNSTSASHQHLLRRLILAYVSRNNSAAMSTLMDFRSNNRGEIPCLASVMSLNLIPGLR